MALETKRERMLLVLVGAAAVFAAALVGFGQVSKLLQGLDEEILDRRSELEKKRAIYSNLEGIEEQFTAVYRDLYLPGEIDQQTAQVVKDLVDLIQAAGIDYGSIKRDENIEKRQEDFYAVRLTIDDIRSPRAEVAKFLYLIDSVATLEIEEMNLRATNRMGDDILRLSVKVTRLIPTKEYMKGIEEL